MEVCPHCGSDMGAYTTYTGRQFYFWDGEPSGYDPDVPDNQLKFVRCLNCDRKVARKRLTKDGGAGC